MSEASARMMLVGGGTVACYTLALLLVRLWPGGAEIVQPAPVWWVGAFAVGVAFAAWNLWDSLLDVRRVFVRHRPQRVIAGGFWRLRSDALQGACCTAWAAAGALSLVQWGTADQRAGLITAGALALVVNQAWNRIDRERIVRMPSAHAEARTMEQVAVSLAADARRMGHDVRDTLQLPVGVLELLRTHHDLTPSEAAEIDLAVGALVTLAEHVAALHARVRALDPTLGPEDGS